MKLPIKLYVYIIILSYTHLPIFSLDPQIEASIDKFIEESFLPKYNIPALGLSIFSGDNGDNMVRGYGFSNLEDKINATPSTLFGIGSISKSFTAILVVKTLSEKFPQYGESVLDIPIRKLMPTYNFTLIDRFRSESVTFRDLMSHRLCLLPDFLGVLSANPFKDKYEFIYRQRYAPEICSFRSEYHYNNGAVALASELIALIAGISLESLLPQLFTEIGMSETTFVEEDVDYDQKVNMSRSYYRNGTVTMKFNPELLKKVCVAIGSGGILSTPNDMLKYLAFHQNKGKVGDQQVVPEEVMHWLSKLSSTIPFNGWKTESGDISIGNFGYGLGLGIGTHDGWERISHGGYLPPYFSQFSLYPTLKLGIFSTTNGPGVLEDGLGLEILHVQIFNILNGKNVSDIGNVYKISKELAIKKSDMEMLAKHSINDPKQFVGLYGNGLSGEFTITELEGSTIGELYVRYGKWVTGILKPISNTTATYELALDSDVIQEDYTYGPILPPPKVLDFITPNKVVVAVIDGTQVIFQKDLTLDKLPPQPWDPASCATNFVKR